MKKGELTKMEVMRVRGLNKALEPIKMIGSVVLTEKEIWTPCPRCGYLLNNNFN